MQYSVTPQKRNGEGEGMKREGEGWWDERVKYPWRIVPGGEGRYY